MNRLYHECCDGKRPDGVGKDSEKEQSDNGQKLDEGAVTVNPKSISRPTFQQLVHTAPEHNFFDFFVATAVHG
jgi:hypothetical protein